MTTKFKGDESLTIQLLSYHKSKRMTEEYYFLEMSTLQVTTLLPQKIKITTSDIVAYTDDNKYLEDQTIRSFKTVGDFNDFFINNPDYYLYNCDIEFENGTVISSHDDGEVSIKFPIDNVDQIFIEKIFETYNLNKTLIEKLKSKPGHYLAIDKKSNITADFETFDEYVKKR